MNNDWKWKVISITPPLVLLSFPPPLSLSPQGGKKVTYYSWSFDDNASTSPPTPIKGFDSASTQQFTYTSPGAYNVTVFAQNNGGNNTARITIFVLGND